MPTAHPGMAECQQAARQLPCSSGCYPTISASKGEENSASLQLEGHPGENCQSRLPPKAEGDLSALPCGQCSNLRVEVQC